MAEDTVRIGFVGAGANTTLRHIPGFKEIEGVDLVSVANRSRASGQRIADEYGIHQVFDNWVDLVEDPDTNAICIGTWPYMHHALVLAALEYDKHVITEARMAMDGAQARDMLYAARLKPNLVTQIVPSPMTLKVDETIQELIADGYLGDVLSVDVAVRQGGFIDRDAPFHWRHNRDLSGYNIMSMGIWYEAMMRWVGHATSVTALTRVNVKSRRDAAGATRHISIPDQIEVLCELESGAVARLGMSTVFGLAPAPEAWLFGTEGTLRVDGGSMTLYGGRRGDSGLSEIAIPPEKQGSWRVEEEFINAIRGKEQVTHTSFEDGVKYMEFTEAVTRSAESGQSVNLPL